MLLATLVLILSLPAHAALKCQDYFQQLQAVSYPVVPQKSDISKKAFGVRLQETRHFITIPTDLRDILEADNIQTASDLYNLVSHNHRYLYLKLRLEHRWNYQEFERALHEFEEELTPALLLNSGSPPPHFHQQQ